MDLEVAVSININQYKKNLMRTMSVGWQNWRCGQSLVAHGRVKMQRQNKMF